jgi:hypothetical protein
MQGKYNKVFVRVMCYVVKLSLVRFGGTLYGVLYMVYIICMQESIDGT